MLVLQLLPLLKSSLVFQKKFYVPFLWLEFNCTKTTLLLSLSPSRSWYSFVRPHKDERLSQPWNHPVVLNKEPLDWEFSTLTTRPLLQQNEVSLRQISSSELAEFVPLTKCYKGFYVNSFFLCIGRLWDSVNI